MSMEARRATISTGRSVHPTYLPFAAPTPTLLEYFGTLGGNSTRFPPSDNAQADLWFDVRQRSEIGVEVLAQDDEVATDHLRFQLAGPNC